MHSLIFDRFSCKTLFTIKSITIEMFTFFLHTKVVHIHVSVTRRWPIENSLVITYISLCLVAHYFLNDNLRINFWGLLTLMFVISSLWVFSCYKQLTKKAMVRFTGVHYQVSKKWQPVKRLHFFTFNSHKFDWWDPFQTKLATNYMRKAFTYIAILHGQYPDVNSL